MSEIKTIKKTFYIRKRSRTIFDLKKNFVDLYMHDDKLLPTFVLVEIDGKPGLVRKQFKDIDKTAAYIQVRRRSKYCFYISSADMANVLETNEATKEAAVLKATPFIENDMEGCILEGAKEEDLL